MSHDAFLTIRSILKELGNFKLSLYFVIAFSSHEMDIIL